MMRIFILESTARPMVLTAMIFLLLSWVHAVRGNDPEILDVTDRALVKAAQKVLPCITTVNLAAGFKAGEGVEGPKDEGIGAGLIVSTNGLILTSAHVVRGAGPVKVTLADRRSYCGVLVASDVESDLAVIRIDAENLPVVEWGDSSKLAVGQMVLTVGSPFGLSRTVTMGIVSAVGRTNVGIIDYEEFIQTDAPINPGSSGGPVVDIQGRVVGITTAMASRGGSSQGVGFAVPSNSARIILEQLIQEGKVHRGALGLTIQDLDTTLAKAFGRTSLEGALVAQTVPGGPADQAGVREGDIILSFNGETVTTANRLKHLIALHKPGDRAQLTVYRRPGPDTFDVHVTLGRRVDKTSTTEAPEALKEKSPSLGLVLETLSAFAARRIGLSSVQGLLVKKVDDGGLGSVTGFKKGDVILEINEEPARDVAQFKAAVAAAEKDKPVRFKIRRGESNIFAAYEPQ